MPTPAAATAARKTTCGSRRVTATTSRPTSRCAGGSIPAASARSGRTWRRAATRSRPAWCGRWPAPTFATCSTVSTRRGSIIPSCASPPPRASGGFERAKRKADAYVVKRQQEAQATLAERSASAEGIRRERAALNSSAGDAYVNLQLIEALQKKEIRQIPKLPNGNIIIDGNRLLQQLGVLRYQQGRDAEAQTPAPNPPNPNP